jgi:hypothetical protein
MGSRGICRAGPLSLEKTSLRACVRVLSETFSGNLRSQLLVNAVVPMGRRNTNSKSSCGSLSRSSPSRALSQTRTLPCIGLMNTNQMERFSIGKDCPIN